MPAFFAISAIFLKRLLKEYYSCTEEEKAEAEKKLKGLSYTHSMLLALHNAAKDTELVDYKGFYKKDAGEILKHCYEVLKPYGWTFANEDAEKVLDGTHELYEKEGKVIKLSTNFMQVAKHFKIFSKKKGASDYFCTSHYKGVILNGKD